MAGLPYMPLYVGDYLADTTHLICTEHGAYLLLLMSMWRNGGSLPDDDRMLARHARCSTGQWARMKPVLMPFFDRHEGQVSHGRLRHDLTAAALAVEQRAERSSNGGKAKALKYKRATAAASTLQACQSESDIEQVVEAKASPPDAASPKPKRGARISENWTPNAGDLARGAELHLTRQEIDHAAVEFRDYWLGRSRDAAKADWSRAFRARLAEIARRRAGMAGRPYPGANGRGDTSFAAIAARRRREDEERMAPPGREAELSGGDHGWADGAIDGHAVASDREG